MATTNIYVLRLQGGKYYVGKSENVAKRYQQHLAGSGSAWTKLHRPVSLVKTIENVSPFQEDAITKEYMEKYGTDNVRGGCYTQIELDDFQKETLNREKWGAKDLCTKCGRSGHFVKDCYATKDVSGNAIYEEEDSEEEDDESEEEEELWGCETCDRTFTTAFGCAVHEKSCKEKSSKKAYVKRGGGVITCFRCGNAGHYATDCYASRHVKGYYLD
jgi:cellular nucleic acid-binding protein